MGNFSGGVLSNGTYQVNGGSTLRLPGANIVTDNASITLSGANSNLYSSATANTDALAGLTMIGSAGSLTVTGGRNYTLSGALTDQGNLTLGEGSLLTVQGGLTVAPGGVLQGSGVVGNQVVNNGMVIGGGGVLKIASSLIQGPSGVVEMILNPPGGFSMLEVGHTAELGGTLDVEVDPGFVPVAGESFDLFAFNGGESGQFSQVNLPVLAGFAWDTSALYSRGQIALVATPEPGGLLAAAGGVAGIVLRRRRGAGRREDGCRLF